jgi:hypothetical protein
MSFIENSLGFPSELPQEELAVAQSITPFAANVSHSEWWRFMSR